MLLEYLHWYLRATHGLATVKEPMWQPCLAHWELVSLVAWDLLSSLCGLTCCKPEVRFGRHRAIMTVLVLTGFNCHSPTRCFSHLWHEQGEFCCCSNSVAGTAMSGISWRLDVMEKVQAHSQYVDAPAQKVSGNTKSIQCAWRGPRCQECGLWR
jgi:hypothetical protein